MPWNVPRTTADAPGATMTTPEVNTHRPPPGDTAAREPAPPLRTRRRFSAIPWALALPGLVFVAVLLIYPALDVIVSSFFTQTGRSIYQREFTGFDNFTRLLNDSDVMATFWRTVVWVV